MPRKFTPKSAKSQVEDKKRTLWHPSSSHANFWYHESNGRVYQLHDELIFSLSEEELHALQRVSANALQAMNLGVPVVIPRDDTCKCQLKATGRGLLARVKRSHTTNISGLLDILKDKEKEGTEDGSSDEAKNLVFGLPLSKVLKNERVRRGVRRAETLCAPGHSRQTSGGSAASGGSGDADGLESQSDAHLKSSSVGSDEAPDEARLAAGERKQKLSTASASDFSTSASSECVFMPPAGPMANFRKNASSISLSVGVGGGSGGTEIGARRSRSPSVSSDSDRAEDREEQLKSKSVSTSPQAAADDLAPGEGAQRSGSPRRRISPSDSQLLLAAAKRPPHAASNLTRTQSAAARDAEKLREKACRLVKPFLVPQIVSNCCDHLDHFGNNQVGLFRVAGSKKRVKELKESIGQGQELALGADTNPHDVATLLKEFFRDMPDPLMTRELHALYTAAHKRTFGGPLWHATLRHLVVLLPRLNRNTLFLLVRFLSRVAAGSRDRVDERTGEALAGNRMDAQNLATCFAQNLFASSSGPPATASGSAISMPSAPDNSKADLILEEQKVFIDVIRELVNQFEDVFRIPAGMYNEALRVLNEEDPEFVDSVLTFRERGVWPQVSTVPEALASEPEESEGPQQETRSRKISVSSLHEEKGRRHPLRKSNKTMSVMGNLMAHMHANVSMMAISAMPPSTRPTGLPEKKPSFSGPSVAFSSPPSASPEDATPTIRITSEEQQADAAKGFQGGRFCTISEEARGTDSEQSSNSHSVECITDRLDVADLSDGDAKSDIVDMQRAPPPANPVIGRSACYAAGKPSSLRNLEYLISDASPVLPKRPIAQATNSAPLAPGDSNASPRGASNELKPVPPKPSTLAFANKTAATSKSTTDLRDADDSTDSNTTSVAATTPTPPRAHTMAAGTTCNLSNTLQASVSPTRMLTSSSHSSSYQPSSSQYSSLANRCAVKPVSRPTATVSTAESTSYSPGGGHSYKSSVSRYRDRFG